MTVDVFGQSLEVILLQQGEALEIIADTYEAQALIDAHDIGETVCIDGHHCMIVNLEILEWSCTYALREGFLLDQMCRLTLNLEEL